MQNTGTCGVKDRGRVEDNRSVVLVFFITQTNETSIIIVSTFNLYYNSKPQTHTLKPHLSPYKTIQPASHRFWGVDAAESD
jgi:hypothetical protein